MARGKVGDVVFSRLNGQQVSRVRNRNPRNPRTNSQLAQRAIMATIMQAYSAGKAIFDHSFQGESVGAKNMAMFMSTNAKVLRSLCASEMSIVPSPSGFTPDVKARIVAPGVNSPVGFDGMVVSSGNYQQNFFGVTPSHLENGKVVLLAISIPAALDDNEKCSQYAARVGLVRDDIYTIVGFYQANASLVVVGGFDDGVSSMGYQHEFAFFAVRLRVKASFVTDDKNAAQGKTLDDLFAVDLVRGPITNTTALLAKTIGSTFSLADIQTGSQDTHLSWGNIIRSRLDQDLRSDTVLKRQSIYQNCGIIPAYMIQAWAQGTANVGDSTLILEGGQGFNAAQSLVQLPTLTDATIAAIPVGSKIFGVVQGTFIINGHAITNPVMAIENTSGHPATVLTVIDTNMNYVWTSDVYGNLTLGDYDPGEKLSEAVATYLGLKFPKSGIETGGQEMQDKFTMSFSI